MTPGAVVDRRFGCADELCSVLADAFWSRRPVVFRRPFDESFVSSDDIVHGLRRLSPVRAAVRVSIDGEPAPASFARICTAADVSPAAYVLRLSREAQAQRVQCAVFDFQRSDENVWLSCMDFTTALYKHIGFPAGSASLVLLLSFDGVAPSLATPLQSDRDTLTWIVDGHRTCLLWSDEVLTEQAASTTASVMATEHLDPSVLRESATVLNARPGDLIYCPAKHWQLDEPCVGVAASLALGIETSAPLLQNVDAVVAEAAHRFRADPFVIGEQPDLAQLRVDTAIEALSSDSAVDSLHDQLLDATTRRAFRVAPSPLESAPDFTDADIVSPLLAGMIGWQRRVNRLCISVNGYGFSVDHRAPLAALIAEINRGEPLRVGDLAQRYCTDEALDRDDLVELLACLHRLRTFRRNAAIGS